MVELHRFGITFEHPYWVVYELDTPNKYVFAKHPKLSRIIHKCKTRDEAYYFIKGKRKEQNNALGPNPSKKGFVRRFLNFVRSHYAS